ncbi:Xaa-Pro dipeptidyl-peptidase [Crossiella sp. CA198]|uniref:Xaa-Pro dipeptidyl-peptidase n=1 Tax=Crossiella sp. CA198 TaxID=3455607 RepID=UPI003F8D042E
MRRARSVPLTVALALAALPLTVAPASAAPPSGPVFADGAAQPVFDPKDVLRENVWVRAPVDSDRDGKDDEAHALVVRPKVTTTGLKVPVVYLPSPYYAPTNDVPNHNVDVELHVPKRPGRDGAVTSARTDERVEAAVGGPREKPIPVSRYEEYFTSRGFAVVYGESLGTGESSGCPTTGGRNETIGAKSIVDWLNGRAPARDEKGAAATATWSTGKTGMMGVSYNGTLPNAVASTGVKGLEAIVPIAAISSWYDYYRADGAVVAPGTYQGEDADVLAEYVHTRTDREICKPIIAEVAAAQDRITGDYSEFWDERNYLNDVRKVKAATLVVHGLNDWNVKTKHAAQWYEQLRKQGTPHKIWWHQSGHSDPFSLRKDEWLKTLNRWFTRYLYSQQNGVEQEPRATLQREDKSWVQEAEWPAPGTREVGFHPLPGGNTTGALSHIDGVHGRPVLENIVDDATKKAEDLTAAAESPHRLSYFSGPAAAPLRVSGTVGVDLKVSFTRPAANLTALLVDRAPDGKNHIITRGWTDPQNRTSEDRTQPLRPGVQYRVNIEMQPDDYVLPAGHKLGLVLLSSDYDYTLRPKPGAGLSVNLNQSEFTLPIVGGTPAVRAAFGS